MVLVVSLQTVAAAASWAQTAETPGNPEATRKALTALLAATNDLYLSSNGGTTWSAAGISPYPSVQAIDYSADGSTIVYSYKSHISVAKNGKWLGPTASPAAVWYSVSTSQDGSVIAGVIYDPNSDFNPNAAAQRGVYLSTDGGASYATLVVSAASYEYFYAVEVSDDGKLLFYSGSGGLWVYNIATKTTTFSDLPVKPMPNDYAVYTVASSSTGQYAIASSANSFLWRTSNYGLNWVESKWYF